MSRPFSIGLLAVLCWLTAAPTSRGQSTAPPPVPAGPDRWPAVPELVEAEPAGSVVATLLETARPLTPWYTDAELAVLFNSLVHANERFAAVRDYNAVFLSPRVYLGRRLESGGSVRFTYRNLTDVGYVGDPYPSSGGDWSSTSTFTTNWFDLDYVSREYAPLTWWRLQGEFGGRLAYRYNGSSYQDPYIASEYSHTYFGGGPHVGLTSHGLLGRSGWAVYGRADTAVTFGGGESKSRYEPSTFYPTWLTTTPSTTRTTTSEFQFDLNLQLGLVKRWQLERTAIGLGMGVQGDVLSMGNLGGGGFNTFGLVNVGPFLRCEIGF